MQQIRGDSRLTLSGSKNIADKVKEIKLAVAVEKQMSKDEILEGYLNIVLFGGQNYGVQAASEYYWGIPASQLSIAQAATLAGMVQSPNYYDPQVNPEASVQRRNVVLDTMVQNTPVAMLLLVSRWWGWRLAATKIITLHSVATIEMVVGGCNKKS